MFGFFDDPFFDTRRYYRPQRQSYVYDPFFGYIPVRQQRRQYVDPFLFNPFSMIFYDNEGPEEQEEKQENPEKKEEVKKETPAAEGKKEETKAVAPKEEKKEEEKPQIWSYSKVFSSHAHGGVEEVREKTYDSRTGETNESQTRRIGDRWCRVDTKTGKDGHSLSKETWHNVADNETDGFKEEWVKRRGISSTATSPEQKLVEHKPDEKPSETQTPPPPAEPKKEDEAPVETKTQ